MSQTQHIVETRFSVRTSFSPSQFTREWLAYRLELLRRFCMPSISAQTAGDFTWVLFCDASTDRVVMEELRAHEQEVAAMEIAITDFSRDPRQIVQSLVDPGADVLITTRVDSDDAIHSEYLEAVQAYAPSFRRSSHADLVINFPRGYRLDAQASRLYASRMYNSPFHSMFERPQERVPTTVITGKHTILHEHHPTHQDESMPAWLQVLHGSNIHNTLVATDRMLPDFGPLASFGLGANALERGDDYA